MNRRNFSILSMGYLADVVIAAFSIWLTVRFAQGLGGHTTSPFWLMIAVGSFAFCMAIGLVAVRLNQTVWRWTTADDLVRLAQAVAIAGVGSVTILFFFDPAASVPRIVPLIGAGVAFVMAAGARGLARAMSGGGMRALFRSVMPDAPATILVGPTESITQAIHAARALGPLPIRPVAIVSTLGNQVGKVFAGAKVYGGLDYLEPLVVDALSRNSSVRIALVGKDPKRKAAQVALEIAGRKGVELMRIAEGSGATLGAVHPADVLGRSRRILDLSAPKTLVRYKSARHRGRGDDWQ
jgi:FlaA1/EpsC-like NDP-sugar epimerase